MSEVKDKLTYSKYEHFIALKLLSMLPDDADSLPAISKDHVLRIIDEMRRITESAHY